MLATVAVLALVLAVLVRRIGWVAGRLPPPASTTAVLIAATAAAMLLADQQEGVLRAFAGAGLTVVLSGAAMLLAGVLADVVVAPIARRLEQRPTTEPLRDRLLARADASRWRVGEWNVPSLVLRSVQRAGAIRITALAAEMGFYALISLVPITTALGSSLGSLRRLIGDEQVEQIRTFLVDGLATIFAQQVASEVLAPLVDGLLSENRTGLAIGALAVTLYLTSRILWAALRALDDAYRVTSRRHVVAQYLLALAFTIGALAALLVIIALVVVGPFLGGGDAVARAFGLGDAFRFSWDVLRWPVAFLLVTLFLSLLYRYAPHVDNTWRHCLPGAAVGSIGILLVSALFSLYVRVATPTTLTDEAGNALVVQAAAQMLSLVVAGTLWLWVASIVVILGGVVNAEMHDVRSPSHVAGTSDGVTPPDEV